jgi:hypothetical protein
MVGLPRDFGVDYASAAGTILLPLIVSALAFYVCAQAWRASQTPDKRELR